MSSDWHVIKLPTLDTTAEPVPDQQQQIYCGYYGLDLKGRYPEVTHHMGMVACADHDIACHYYQLSESRGTVWILHGYFDHVGLYSNAIEYAVSRGYDVVAFDLPGHGLSSGDRSDIDEFSDYVKVLEELVDYFQEIAPKPWRAIAQSTGGAILMDHLMHGGDDYFEQSVLLAPLVRPTHWHKITFQHSLMKHFIKSVKRVITENSSNPEFIEFIKQDPLQASRIPLSWIQAMRNWEQRFIHYPASIHAPLVIQGLDDTTVDWRHNLRQLKNKFPACKIFKIKEARHHLVNESEGIRQTIWQAIDLHFGREEGVEVEKRLQ